MMTISLSDKVAIVTGGARGIGKGIVNSLVSNGVKVVFVVQNDKNGKQTESQINKEYNNSVTFFKGDVSIKKENIKAVEIAINVYGKLDIICANTGIYPLTWIKIYFINFHFLYSFI